MADLYNDFPSWGESGEFPVSGFFYEGGDQVNEKHFDALWNGVQEHVGNLNEAVRRRVEDLSGNVVLDRGLVVTQGSGSREVDISSSVGAYVSGEFSGSVTADTLTLSANGSGSVRTDVVWVDDSGSVGRDSDTTSVEDDQLKLAEVDVATDDSIDDIRNETQYHASHFASEAQPSGSSGDIWHDLSTNEPKIYVSGSWERLFNATTYKGNDIDTDGDGVVNEADYANDADASTYKGNDLDTDGDGVVNEADDTTTVKGNDIDSNGDGKVDSAETADDATNVTSTYKGNDLDTDGDGVVNEADDTTTVKGNDIDSNGDGTVNDSDQYSGLSPSDGSTGQFLRTDGTSLSWEQAGNPLQFGDGSDGNVTKSTDETVSGVVMAQDFTLEAGTTLTVDPNTPGYVIYATGTVTINGTIDAVGAGSNGGGGGAGNFQEADNGAPGQDSGAIPTQGGGGGGSGGDSLAGSGGSGGSGDTSAYPVSNRFSVDPSSAAFTLLRADLPDSNAGAGGGGGGGGSGRDAYIPSAGGDGAFPGGGGGGGWVDGDTNGPNGGNGGDGGGTVVIFANEVNGSGTINCSGQDGQNGSYDSSTSPDVGSGGGGGGSGGLVCMAGIVLNETITVIADAGTGGAGGTGANPDGGDGANGAPGIVIREEV